MDIEKYSRQGGLIPETSSRIAILGVGNVGSYVALMLTKIGLSNIVLVDDDVVELPNTATQLFSEANIGQLKTEATASLCEQLAGIRPETATIADQKRLAADYIILAIDSIEGRLQAIDDTRETARAYIDSRQGALNIEVYTGRADYIAENLRALNFSQASACAAKGIAFTSAITGGLVANEMRKILTAPVKNQFFRLSLDDLLIFKSKNYGQENAAS